jgi:hypothetical protein
MTEAESPGKAFMSLAARGRSFACPEQGEEWRNEGSRRGANGEGDDL